MTLDVSSEGRIYAKSQVTDYVLRGDTLSDCSLFEFVKNTYDGQLRPQDNAASTDEGRDKNPRRGRPRNARARYRYPHPCATTKIRVQRTAGHRNLVNIVGRWLPRADDDDIRELYCASMLMLLVPWRNLASDLKRGDESWEEAFGRLEEACSDADQYVISGIQYFHECALAAEDTKTDGDESELHTAGRQRRGLYSDMLEDDDDPMGAPYDEDEQRQYTVEGLAALKAMQMSLSEHIYALDALGAGQHAEFFPALAAESWRISSLVTPVAAAAGEDLVNLERWKAQLATNVLQQHVNMDVMHETTQGTSVAPSVRVDESRGEWNGPGVQHELPEDFMAEAALAPVDVGALRHDQYRAYDIVVWHLEQSLAGAQIPPLRMILYGEGGTGKSRVIQTITEAFAARSASYMLVKAAYTGIAASLVDGKTTHIIGHISVASDGRLSEDGRRLLQAFWRRKRYLVVDEYSMLAKTFLAQLSRNIGIGVEGEDGLDHDASFGGISVILCGDLHQFPPVACAHAEALFKTTDLERDLDRPDRVLGRRIYDEFSVVVVLREQMRVSDPVWRDFLVHLRYGRVQPDHLKMLRSLVVGGTGTQPPQSLSGSEWREAALVTPRHGVRKAWNTRAARKSCADAGQRLYIVTAEDRIQNRELTLEEQYAVAGRSSTENRRSRKDLPEQIELAVGMKVMVTTNIQIDLDIANGSRGEVVGIVLHPDEPAVPESNVVKLKYVPSYVLVKMARTRAGQLEDLDVGVIPVEPTRMTMKINIRREGNKPVQRTVQRRQFPITCAYAFTDYRSQGQTIPTVVVDIKSPPGPQKLSLFNLYVALSRSSGRQTIRLLRDFDDSELLQRHDTELLNEDLRLDELDRLTREWWEQMGRSRK